MRRLSEKFGRHLMYIVLALFAVGLTGCNGDDDVDNVIDPEDPTGTIVAEDQTLMNNTIVVESVDVDQDSWLYAVKASEPNTPISDTATVNEGVNANVTLTINDSVEFTGGSAGTEIMLKLFADNPDAGTQGELDSTDVEVENEDGTSANETITVYLTSSFADFDINEDGILDNTEVTGIYENDFDLWDSSDDGFLNREEFDATAFSLTDYTDDEVIDEDEWDDGFASFFGNWNEDNFETFDVDGNDSLSTAEWNDAFVDSEWFGTFDSDDDELLDEEEWDEGLFNDWDTNDDLEIDEVEFNVFYPYVLNWGPMML